LDGGHHAEVNQKEYDDKRSEYFIALGMRVVRFWNNDTVSDLEEVLDAIRNALKDQTTLAFREAH